MGIEINNDISLNVHFRDLFKDINLKDQKIGLDIKIPDSFFQSLLEQFLERSYLNETNDKIFYKCESSQKKAVNWVQIERLPIHPNQNTSYDLLSRWQGALSSLHAWNYKLMFLLLRHKGETKIFLGTTSDSQLVSPEAAAEQIKEATFASMPGIGLKTLSKLEIYDDVLAPLNDMHEIGGITGIPSFQNNKQNEFIQTLDQLAFGIKDVNGYDKDYALLVIADPIKDAEISDLIAKYRTLGSQIHSSVKMTASESSSRSQSKSEYGATKGVISGLSSVLGGIVGSFLGNPFSGRDLGHGLASAVSGVLGLDAQVTAGGSTSVNTEFLDKFAEYAELITEKHIGRLNEGRNLGFWNTGVYVLGNMPNDITTVTGMLRAIYSGDESYLEPIRLHLFNKNSNAREIVCNRFELLPMVDVDARTITGDKFDLKDGQWHVLGKHYQYISTPLNTKELSLTTSLPRRDVPGLRFVKTAVRFANNPAVIKKDKISLGKLVDMGISQEKTYDIDVNSLVRHALVAGYTGSGKSTTCKEILSEVIDKDIPIMVIELAKDDYVRWAIEQNKYLPDNKKFKIFMPGVQQFDGEHIEELKINGYEPACFKDAKADVLQHTETFSTLLNACLPSEEVIPIIIEEVVYKTIEDHLNLIDKKMEDGEIEPLSSYPDIDSMIGNIEEVMKEKTYVAQTKGQFNEILKTRFNWLGRGTRGRILNVKKSMDYNELFSNNVIINISRLSGSKDKALIMSLLMNALYEYRISQYANSDEYRKKAQENKLMHLCLVEEAHNVLLKPKSSTSSGSPQNAIADLFGNMLSEIRGYGQGFVIVDQVPTRLIDDVVKNTNYKIVHRLTAPDDQEVMASCMAFREDQKYIIPTLEKGNAIVCGDEDDAAVWVKIIPKLRSNK